MGRELRLSEHDFCGSRSEMAQAEGLCSMGLHIESGSLCWLQPTTEAFEMISCLWRRTLGAEPPHLEQPDCVLSGTHSSFRQETYAELLSGIPKESWGQFCRQ